MAIWKNNASRLEVFIQRGRNGEKKKMNVSQIL